MTTSELIDRRLGLVGVQLAQAPALHVYPRWTWSLERYALALLTHRRLPSACEASTRRGTESRAPKNLDSGTPTQILLPLMMATATRILLLLKEFFFLSNSSRLAGPVQKSVENILRIESKTNMSKEWKPMLSSQRGPLQLRAQESRTIDGPTATVLFIRPGYTPGWGKGFLRPFSRAARHATTAAADADANADRRSAATTRGYYCLRPPLHPLLFVSAQSSDGQAARRRRERGRGIPPRQQHPNRAGLLVSLTRLVCARCSSRWWGSRRRTAWEAVTAGGRISWPGTAGSLARRWATPGSAPGMCCSPSCKPSPRICRRLATLLFSSSHFSSACLVSLAAAAVYKRLGSWYWLVLVLIVKTSQHFGSSTSANWWSVIRKEVPFSSIWLIFLTKFLPSRWYVC